MNVQCKINETWPNQRGYRIEAEVDQEIVDPEIVDPEPKAETEAEPGPDAETMAECSTPNEVEGEAVIEQIDTEIEADAQAEQRDMQLDV